MCIALQTIVAHNTAQNRPDNFPSYPPDNHIAPMMHFGTKIAITGFVRTTATRQLVIYGAGFEWLTDRLQILPIPCTKGRCHGNHFLAFYIWGAHWRHLVNTTQPSVRRRCGLMSNYFDHLLLLVRIAFLRTEMRPVVTDRVACSDGLTLCLSLSLSHQ